MSHISQIRDGVKMCHTCGHRWQEAPRFRWWPIWLRWTRRRERGLPWFRRYRAWLPPDGPYRPVVRYVLHFGRLCIVIGPRTVPRTVTWSATARGWYPIGQLPEVTRAERRQLADMPYAMQLAPQLGDFPGNERLTQRMQSGEFL